MKALEKDRNRRYDSASELGQDIERYLNDEPVLACPPSMGYRLQKFVKRHKGLLAALTLILISAILGTAFSFFYAQRATVALREANQARILAEDNQRKADRANARSRTLLYASDMKLTSDAIANNDVPRAAELLQRHLPHGGEPDLRSFEWHYFRKRIQKPQQMTLTPGGRVDDLALSPDGRWLAAVGASGSVFLYETATWAEKRVFPTSTELVHGLAWSPDNRLIAAACADGTVRLHDVASGDERKIDAHQGRAKDVAFSRDGRHLFSCGEDKLAKSWDLETGESSLVFQGHQRTVERLELSPDGKTLATVGSDGSLILWDAESSERLQKMEQREGRMVCVAFSPDGRTVVAGNINGFLYRLDVKTWNQQLLAKQLDGVEAVAFFAGGDWLVAADRGGAIRFHAMAAERNLKPNSPRGFHWVAHEGRAVSLAATNDGQSLISGGRDGLVQVWKPDLRALRWSPEHQPDHSDIALGSESELYLAGDGISTWNLDKRKRVEKFAASDSPWKLVACSQNGRFLAAARVGRLELFELPSQRRVAAWNPEPRLEPHRIGISPDGRRVAFAEYTDRDHVTVFDRDTKKAKKYPAEQCECVGFSPDGRWLAAGHMDDLRLFDLETEADPLVLKGHTNTLRSFAFRPDGRMIVTASHDRLLKVWRLPDGQEQFSIVAHRDRVTSVMFTPDGRTIATTGRDRRLKLWHAATGQPLGTLDEGHDGLQKIAFTKDGQRLVGLFEDDSVIVFDVSGRPGSQ